MAMTVHYLFTNKGSQMNILKQNGNDRRDFLKNAGLFSLVSLSGLTGHRPKITGDADAVVEIHSGNKVAVMIGVFTVQPENEQKLIELFKEGTLSISSRQPGYISSSFHKGSDSKRVVLYEQWASPEHIVAFTKTPEAGPYFKKIGELATVEAIICDDVPFVYHK